MNIFNKIKKALRIRNRIKKIPEDLFIKRLRSLVVGEGMLHEGNIYLIDYAIKNMPKNGVVFEIGSYGGLSTNLILYLLTKNNRAEQLINCDPWVYEGFTDYSGIVNNYIDGRKDILREDYTKYMKANFMNSIKFLNPQKLPFSFQMKADEFFNLYNKEIISVDIFSQKIQLGAEISFAFIDGNHEYSHVKNDFENVHKYLKKNGFVLFDDSIDDLSFGSALFMKEMQRNRNYILIDKNPNYLFRKIS